MVAEALEKYSLTYVEVVYEYPGQHAPMVSMEPGGEFHEAGNASHWLDQKHSLFTITTCSENTKWETIAMCMSVDEEAIRKATDRFKTPL